MTRFGTGTPSPSARASKFLGVTAALCGVLLVGAACGSPGGGQAGSNGGGSNGGGGAAKSVIKIGSEMPLADPLVVMPQLEAGIQAAISSINAAGGIAGHKLQLVACDTSYQANKELSCMRTLIGDHVSAVVAPAILNDPSGSEYELSKAANIPVVGSLGLTEVEYNSPGVFPLVGGIPSWYFGAVEHLLAIGKRHIAFLGESTPGAVLSGQLTEDAIKSAGLAPTDIVNTDTNSDPTFAVGAAKAIGNHTDGVVIGTNPQFLPKAYLALRNAGFTGPISTISAIVPPASIKALGPAGNGLLITSDVALPSDSADPSVATFLAAMKKYQPGASLEELTMDGWAATQLLAKVAGGLSDLSGSSVMSAFEKLSSPVDIGVLGSFAQPTKPPYLAKFPDIYNPSVVNGSVRDGVIVSDGKGFVNPFSTLVNLVGK